MIVGLLKDYSWNAEFNLKEAEKLGYELKYIEQKRLDLKNSITGKDGKLSPSANLLLKTISTFDSTDIWILVLLKDFKPIHYPPFANHEEKSERLANGRYRIPRSSRALKIHPKYIDTILDNPTFVWTEEIKEPTYPNWLITDVSTKIEENIIKKQGGIILKKFDFLKLANLINFNING